MSVPIFLKSLSKQGNLPQVCRICWWQISFPEKQIASDPESGNGIVSCGAGCDSVSCDDLVTGIDDEQVTGCEIVGMKIGTDDCDVMILIHGHDPGCGYDFDYSEDVL